jgi:hypothetical protein
MSNTLKVTLALDNSNFKKGIDEAKKSVEGFSDNSNEASAAVEKIEKKLARQISTAKTYSRQVASMKEAIVGYTIAFNDLDEQTQNSDFGKSLQARIEELTNSAAELQDAITETSNAIRLQSDGEIMYQATIDGLDILANSMQTVIGIQGVFGGSTEKMIQAMQTMQTVQAAANTVTKMTAALQRDSAIAQTAARLATSQNTVAVIAGTAAQKAMNIAVKANPYIIAAAALAALVAGVYKFITAETEAEKKQREFNESLETKYVDTYVSTISDGIGKFKLLQTQWKNLRTESEKLEWIQNNTKEFDKLGMSISNINDAQNVFVTNSQKVIDAIMKQGQAAAAASLYTDIYKEKYKNEMEISKMSNSELADKGSSLGIKKSDYADVNTTYYSGNWGAGSNTTYSNVDYNKLKEMIIARENARFDNMIKTVEAQYTTALKEQSAAFESLKTSGIKTTGNSDAAVKESVENVKAAAKDSLTGMQFEIPAPVFTIPSTEMKPIDLFPMLDIEPPIDPFIALRERAEEEYQKMIDKGNELSENVRSIGSSFSQIGGAIGGTTGEMISFFGTAIQGAADIIPIITKMIAAKNAEAIAGGTASAASTPFPGNIAAILSIVGIIASVFASLPKFAEGGVFKGTSLGDMNIARVNGGEMILNSRQQENLFKMINGNMHAISEPQTITWRLKGADLYGSMENYKKSKRKTGIVL